MKERSGEVGNAGFCNKCQQWNPDGPDICLGRLVGVVAACCGHGKQMPYVAFGYAEKDYDPNGYTTIAFYDELAEKYFAHVKAHPENPPPFSLGFSWDGWQKYYEMDKEAHKKFDEKFGE